MDIQSDTDIKLAKSDCPLIESSDMIFIPVYVLKDTSGLIGFQSIRKPPRVGLHRSNRFHVRRIAKIRLRILAQGAEIFLIPFYDFCFESFPIAASRFLVP